MEKNEERESETGDREWRGERREKQSELPMACRRWALEFVTLRLLTGEREQ